MKQILTGIVIAAFTLLTGSGARAQLITSFAGNGISGYSGDGGPAISAAITLNQVAVDRAGNLYMADWASNRIRKVSTSGVISTVAGNGVGGFSGDGGLATNAQLNGPYGVTLDDSGNLYIADTYNERIRKVNSSGIISTIAGNGTPGYYGNGGLADTAKLNRPVGVAVDHLGNLYIADLYNNCVRKVSTTNIISTIAGVDTAGFSGDGGLATVAKLWAPQGIAVDSVGNVYIADWSNNRVRKVDTSGIITTLAGNGIGNYSGDGGIATAAELYYPNGVAVDRKGNVFIADSYNNRIRKVTPSGIIITVAGNGAGGFSGDGGPANAAKIYKPTGIAVDSSGNLFISDYWNYRIRRVSDTVLPITGLTSICVNAATTLHDATEGGIWSSTNVAIAKIDSAGQVTAVAAGVDTIKYGGIVSSVLTVNPLPTPVIHLLTNFTLATGVYVSYQWNYNGTTIPGATQSTYVYTQNGGYTVTVTDSNGCTGTSAVFVPSSIPNFSALTSLIKIYPNPAVDIVHISSPVRINLSVTTLDGRVVITKNDINELDVRAFGSGVYIIRISDMEGNLLKVDKIIKL